MTALAEFLIAALDLAAVKLGQARVGTYQFLLTLVLLGLAALFLAAGGALLLVSVNLALRGLLPPWVAHLVTAALSLAFGAALVWAGKARTE